MNLYKLHSKPKVLLHSDKIDEIPQLAWAKLTNSGNIRNRNKYTQALAKSLEPTFLKDPGITMKYLNNFIFQRKKFNQDTKPQRYKPAEPILLTSPKQALAYAKKYIRGPWPEAEDIIATDAKAAEGYAYNVLRERWPKGEAAILTNMDVIIEYAEYTIRGRWPEGEAAILKNAVEKGRADVIIAYCQGPLNAERWPEAEKVLLKNANPEHLAEYASDIIRDRWKPAEKFIKKDRRAWEDYDYHVDL